MTHTERAELLKAMGAQALTRGFKISEHSADKLLVVCKVCKQRWTLAKTSKHAGNVLHLLNHEAGHK